MIEDGSKVRLHYTLSVDGQVVESSEGKEPLEYQHGSGQIIPGLEQELAGLGLGDKKEVVVTPEKAYGTPDPGAVQTVPKAAFQEPEKLQAGAMVAGKIQGQPFQAQVVEVDPENVTLDLNHPLAGKSLHFDVEIVSVD